MHPSVVHRWEIVEPDKDGRGGSPPVTLRTETLLAFGLGCAGDMQRKLVPSAATVAGTEESAPSILAPKRHLGDAPRGENPLPFRVMSVPPATGPPIGKTALTTSD